MRILLLAGGESNERSVSLESGEAIYQALKRLGHHVFAIDPSNGKSLLNSDGSFIEYKKGESGQPLVSMKRNKLSLAKTLGSPAFQDIEVVFLSLHGGSGENGMIQCLLDVAGRKYTGSDMTASAIAMDKAVGKRLCISEGIKTADFSVYRLNNTKIDQRLIDEISHRFQFPLIVKPNDGGSTIGLSKVDREEDLLAALERAMLESTNIMVEEYINGREITVSVLDGRPLPLVEIKPKSGLYDFEAKYNKGLSEYITPAKVDTALSEELQLASKKIYNIMGCSGLARADFLLDENNDFYFLEINSLPGMTELSLAPMAANAVGISYDALIEQMIKSAKER